MKRITKKVILIIAIICFFIVISALCSAVIRTTYMCPYVVADDFSYVKCSDKEYISVADIPGDIDQDTEGVLEQGRFESQSVIEKTFASKTAIDVFRYDNNGTVYLKVAVAPNNLISFDKVEQQIYYFQEK